MNKNNFIKQLLVAGLCALTATATMGAVACKPDKEQHEHTYSTEWISNNKMHWHESECGHDVTDGEDTHTWGSDDKCTVCKYERKLIKPTLSESDDPAPDVDEDGKIAVKYEFYAQDYEAKTYDKDLKSGIYTVCNGTTIRNRTRYELKDDTGTVVKSGFELKKSIQMANASSKVTVNAPAAGKLTIWVQDGSGKTDYQQITLKSPNGTSKNIDYPAKKYSSSLQLVEIEISKDGLYEITRPSGTSDIFYMVFEAKVVNSPVESIEIASTGTVDYYVGQTFGLNGLAVNAVHETTGRISPLQTGRLQVDYNDFDNTTAGTYEIGVSYEKSGKTYTTSYNVNVYSYDELKLGTDTVVKGSNTSADNGTYVNHSLRQLYFKGNSLSTDGLSVILNGQIGANKNSFLLGKTLYTVSPVDMTTTGKKTVTVEYTTNGITKQNTFNIYVIEKDAELATATSVNVAVDGNLADENVGIKNGDGAYQFKTIHQALEFLENSGVQNGASKTISLAAGTYWEKLEIKVPNLTIIGAGKDTTKIEYDSLYGAKDDGGYEHVTDSTATMNVREAAVNFTMKNVTVSNYYNSVAAYKGAPSTDQRALAILIQADKVTIDNCGLLGYQDTIELFTGRQYIVNSYISGTTDFIFGTNNTTYFKGCEIHSIDNGKTDGGYITAFKGNNKDANDAITYGAIFDQCHFTADTKVVENKNTAIGRPWGAYANVAVINSEIDGHVSTKGYSGASKNERYVSMSGVAPTASTVKFVEYNNTGAGSIKTEVAGMKMLTESQAENYNNYQVIFGTPNGYTTVWEPVSSDVETHTVTVKDSEGTALFELQVEDGSALTLAKLTEKLAETSYAQYDISGVYSDSECQTEYLYPEISAEGEIYLTLVLGPFTANAEYNFGSENADNVVPAGTAESKYIGKLKIDANETGSFEWHGGGWSKLTGDATMTLKLNADTKVTVTSYNDGLEFTLDGEPLDVDFVTDRYVVDVRAAGDLVIKMKENAPHGVGYVKVVKVQVNAGLSMTQSDVKVHSGDAVVNSFQVWNGDLILKSKIDAIKDTLTPPEGEAFLGYFSDEECNTQFDFSAPVAAETHIYIGWGTPKPYFEEDTTITFGSSGNYSNYVGTKLIVDKGQISVNGGDNCEIGTGSEVSIMVKGGTTVKVTGYPSYTCFTVKIDGVDYVADGDTDPLRILGDWTYVATADCTITFVGGRRTTEEGGGSNYFKVLEITMPSA